MSFSCLSDGCTDALAYALVDAIFYTPFGGGGVALLLGGPDWLGRVLHTLLSIGTANGIEFYHFWSSCGNLSS